MQNVPQGEAACRIGTGPQRIGPQKQLACARMDEAKKACAPFRDTGRKSRLVKGSLRGLLHRQRPDGGPQAVPVATQEATGIDNGIAGTMRGPKNQRRWR